MRDDYTFSKLQNGHLLFHPAMWMDENYLEDPAHVDISNVEGENQGKENSIQLDYIYRPKDSLIMRPRWTGSSQCTTRTSSRPRGTQICAQVATQKVTQLF